MSGGEAHSTPTDTMEDTVAKTKKDLLAEARDKGIEANENMTNDEIQALLDKGGNDSLTQPSAGVEGRSLDPDHEPEGQDEVDTPHAEQSAEGKFEKTYVVLGEGEPEGDRLEDYERNVRQQAQQVGLRTTGDVKFVGSEEHSDGKSTRLNFEVPVVKAATHAGDVEPTVSAVVENDGVGDDEDDKADLEPAKPDA